MSLPRGETVYTVEEYLAAERESGERREYLDGLIYAMAGESVEHGLISTNLTRIISTRLLGGPCSTFSKDMKVRSGPEPGGGTTQGLYSYPDLVVVCGEMRFHDRRRDVLLNPTLIVEVLSPSTEAFDRGRKWMHYQTWLPGLSDYLLVSQKVPLVEHYERRGGGVWAYTRALGLEESVRLNSIDCELRLADVFDRLTFPPPEEWFADDEDEPERRREEEDAH
jgi:Uma2 family endonuclease